VARNDALNATLAARRPPMNLAPIMLVDRIRYASAARQIDMLTASEAQNTFISRGWRPITTSDTGLHAKAAAYI